MPKGPTKAPADPQEWHALANDYRSVAAVTDSVATQRAYNEIAHHCNQIAIRLSRLEKAETRRRILRTA